MIKSLADLNAERYDLMLRLIDTIAVERGYDDWDSLSHAERMSLTNETELAYEAWCDATQSGEVQNVIRPVDALLDALHTIDDRIHAVMHGPVSLSARLN